MGFPYTFHANFEAGDTSEFDSETDANGVLNIKHFRKVLISKDNPVPQRGACLMEVNLSGAGANQYLQEDDGFDIALDAELYVGFWLYVTSDLVMATTNRFTVLTLQSTGPVDEAVVDIKYTTADGYQILAAETGSASTVAATNLTLGEWHFVELHVNLDEGVGNDGALNFYVDGEFIGAIGSLDQAAVIQARLGALGVDAGTTAGRLYISEVFADDGRIYPLPERYETVRTIVKSEHVFVGPGAITTAALLSTTAGNKLQLFDTDDYSNTPHAESFRVEVAVGAHTSFSGPITFKRGCYALLTGTNPRGNVVFVESPVERGVVGPLLSDGAIRHWAASTR